MDIYQYHYKATPKLMVKTTINGMAERSLSSKSTHYTAIKAQIYLTWKLYHQALHAD